MLQKYCSWTSWSVQYMIRRICKKKARGDFPYQLVLPSSGSSKQKSWQKSNPWTPKNQHLETKGVPIFETPTNIAQLIPCNWKAFGSQTGTSRSSYVAQILSGDLLCEYQIRQTHADPPVKKQKKLRHILYYGSVVSIPFPPQKKNNVMFVTRSCFWMWKDPKFLGITLGKKTQQTRWRSPTLTCETVEKTPYQLAWGELIQS